MQTSHNNPKAQKDIEVFVDNTSIQSPTTHFKIKQNALIQKKFKQK